MDVRENMTSVRLSTAWLAPSTIWIEEKTHYLYMYLVTDGLELLNQTSINFWMWMAMILILLFAIYYYLVLPLNIVKDLSEVGFDFLSDGSFKSAKYRGKSKKQLINEINKLRKIGQIPPPYPNGWFVLLESQDLKNNEVKHVAGLGENFAVFRTNEGVVHVLDAYCPHLGANLAIGGAVRGNCLECPFHKWSFHGETGKCASIPYADKIPEVARVKKWKSIEVNDFIMVWYHAEEEEPNWYPEQAKVISEEHWKFQGRAEYFVSSHIEDVPENGADVAHLNAIHKPSMFAGSDLRFYERLFWQFSDHDWHATWEQSQEHKHIGVMKLVHKARVFGKYDVLTMNVKAVQIGPGYVELYMDSTLGPLLLFLTVTPVEPLLQRVVHRMYSPAYLTPFAKFALLGETIMFERDVMVWNHKKYVDKPIIVKEDKTLSKHRRWFSQFYSENSKRFTFSQDTLEW